MGKLSIGQLAQRVGVNIETIRYYERRGLLQPPFRTSNGRRSYGDDDLRRLMFIRNARAIDFSIDDTRTLLTIQETDGGCDQVIPIAQKHLTEIRRKILKAVEAEQRLAAALAQCGPASPCAVLTLLRAPASGAADVTEQEA